MARKQKNPREIKAEYVHSEDEFVLREIMGSLTLAYGRTEKKSWKGIAFSDTEIARRVAEGILIVCDILDEVHREKKRLKKTSDNLVEEG